MPKNALKNWKQSTPEPTIALSRELRAWLHTVQNANGMYDAAMRCRDTLKSGHEEPIIACVGTMNHGKSTLLNALCEEDERFKTTDARTTTCFEDHPFDGVVLRDTPGTDFSELDTEEAACALDHADLVLLVHSVKDGEFQKSELDQFGLLWRAAFPDKNSAGHLALVFTKCLEAETEARARIVKSSIGQVEKEAGRSLTAHFLTDALTSIEHGLKTPLGDGIEALHIVRNYIWERAAVARKAREGQRLLRVRGQVEELLSTLADREEKCRKRVEVRDDNRRQLQDDLWQRFEQEVSQLDAVQESLRKYQSQHTRDVDGQRIRQERRRTQRGAHLIRDWDRRDDAFIQQRNQVIADFARNNNLEVEMAAVRALTSRTTKRYKQYVFKAVRARVEADCPRDEKPEREANQWRSLRESGLRLVEAMKE